MQVGWSVQADTRRMLSQRKGYLIIHIVFFMSFFAWVLEDVILIRDRVVVAKSESSSF